VGLFEGKVTEEDTFPLKNRKIERN